VESADRQATLFWPETLGTPSHASVEPALATVRRRATSAGYPSFSDYSSTYHVEPIWQCSCLSLYPHRPNMLQICRPISSKFSIRDVTIEVLASTGSLYQPPAELKNQSAMNYNPKHNYSSKTFQASPPRLNRLERVWTASHSVVILAIPRRPSVGKLATPGPLEQPAECNNDVLALASYRPTCRRSLLGAVSRTG